MNKCKNLEAASLDQYTATCKDQDGNIKRINFSALKEFLDLPKNLEVVQVTLSRNYDFTINSIFSIEQTGDVIEDEAKHILRELNRLADVHAQQVFLENSIDQSIIDYIYACGRIDGLNDPQGLCPGAPSVEKVLKTYKGMHN